MSLIAQRHRKLVAEMEMWRARIAALDWVRSGLMAHNVVGCGSAADHEYRALRDALFRELAYATMAVLGVGMVFDKKHRADVAEAFAEMYLGDGMDTSWLVGDRNSILEEQFASEYREAIERMRETGKK